jgi:hypothetical protein
MAAIVRSDGGLQLPDRGHRRFAETDAQGVAHNAAPRLVRVARIDYLARYAHGYKHIREQGYRRSRSNRTCGTSSQWPSTIASSSMPVAATSVERDSRTSTR